MPEGKPVKVATAKGRPMLSWVGKRPLREVRTYPAQLLDEEVLTVLPAARDA